MLSRRDKPFSSKDLREKLLRLWKHLNQWKMIPLGRGFFEFRFSSADDLRSFWSSGSLNLHPGLLRLSCWSPDFNPFNQNQTHSHVWVRFHYLPLEYWQTRTLTEIAWAIGTPITIDENTTNLSFGHYARVLVDIDLAGFLPYPLWVEREKFSFDIEIEYEKIPYFCFTCNSIGHSSDHCRKDPANRIARESVIPKNDHAKTIKPDWVPKRLVFQVQSCNKVVTDKDPIVFNIIRSKEVAASVLVGDVINLEEELGNAVVVVPVQVEIVHAIEQTENQSEDQQSKHYPDMRIVGPWSDVVTNQDYTQDLQSWCGGSSSEVVLNPNIVHDLEILRQHCDIGPRVYTDEEETTAAMKYLHNRSAASEEPFTKVVYKKNKKQKGFPVHFTRSRGRLPD